MKIYDISQELIEAVVYPGDPRPVLNTVCSMNKGDLYNLTTFSACSHNGTHIDAPRHFIENGKTVGELDLAKVVGEASVLVSSGSIDKKEAASLLEKASAYGSEAAKRLLIKGDAVMTPDGAQFLLEQGVVLVGTESQSVGAIDSPMAVHKILLCKEVVLLEGIRLSEISEGKYFLFAAPINIGSAEGSPCRAVLVDFENK